MELCPVDSATMLALGCVFGMFVPPFMFVIVKIGAIAIHSFINPPPDDRKDL